MRSTQKSLSSQIKHLETLQRDVVYVDAVYSNRTDIADEGNPLIQAIPSFISAESVIQAFGNFPSFCVEDRDESKNFRIYKVGALSQYIEPLTCHPELIESIFQLITQGYTWRNPSVNIREQIRKNYQVVMEGGGHTPILPMTPSNAPCLALFGVSGVGKTTSINRILSFFPPVIKHKSQVISGLQVVWLKVDCPPDGSINQLFHWILIEFDRLLGTKYAKEIGRNARLDQLINKVAAVAKYHYTGVIVIDEIQFAVKGARRRGDELMDFLVAFSNAVSTPLLLAGTPKALALFETTFRLARRAGDTSTIICRNLDFDEEWEFFISNLFEYQSTKHPIRLTPELSKTLYALTQGIHSLVIRLFQLAQVTVIRDGTETLSCAVFERLAAERFGPLQPMLKALREKNHKKIAQYEDLLPSTLSGLNDSVSREIRTSQIRTAAETRQKSGSQLDAVSRLVGMGVPQDAALRAVAKALSYQPSLTGPALLQAVLDSEHHAHADSSNSTLTFEKSIIEAIDGESSISEIVKRLDRAHVIHRRSKE